MRKNVLILSTLPINRFDFFKRYMEKHYNVIVSHSLLREDKILEMPTTIDGLIFGENIDCIQINQIKKNLSSAIYCNRLDTYNNHHNTAIDSMLTFSTLRSAFKEVIKKLFSDCVVYEVLA